MRTHFGERAHPPAALVALAVLLFSVGCDDGTDAGAQRAREPEPAAERGAPSALALHMTGRYARATDLRDAIVQGDLRSANTIARELAQPVRLERLPPEASSHVVGVHVRAQEVAEATSLLDASAAFAALARSCGECHAAAGVQPSAPLPPVPAPDSPREGGRMRRHDEAVQAMWEGLLFGSTERFDAGARILANAPLTKPEQQGNAELRRLADEARAYARTATRSDGLAGRSEQFGLLLTRCSECHATARGAER